MYELLSFLFTWFPKEVAPIVKEVDIKYLIAIQTVGIGLMTYTLTLTPDFVKKIREMIKLDMLSTDEQEELNHLRSIVLLFRFYQFFGISYFLAILIVTVKFMLVSLAIDMKILAAGLDNATAILTIVPSVLICIVFFFHKIFPRKLEGVVLQARYWKYILLD